MILAVLSFRVQSLSVLPDLEVTVPSASWPGVFLFSALLFAAAVQHGRDRYSGMCLLVFDERPKSSSALFAECRRKWTPLQGIGPTLQEERIIFGSQVSRTSTRETDLNVASVCDKQFHEIHSACRDSICESGILGGLSGIVLRN